MARSRSLKCDGHTLLIRRALSKPTKTDDPVAVGFEDTVEQRAQDQSGQMQCWQERRLVVRSLAFAASQEKSLRQRAARAVAEINALDERKQGKKLLPDEAAARQAAEAILATHRVAALVQVDVTDRNTRTPQTPLWRAPRYNSAQRARARVCCQR